MTGLSARELVPWSLPVMLADDPCEAASDDADPTGPRKYYRARYYDPKAGRFISEDPIGLVGGIDLYAYVENGPVTFGDPLGLIKWRVSFDIEETPGGVLPGGRTGFSPKLGVVPECECLGGGRWSLEYRATATIRMRVPAGGGWWRSYIRAHEQWHADMLARNLRTWALPLTAVEGPKYTSKDECEEAGWNELKKLKAKANFDDVLTQGHLDWDTRIKRFFQ